MSERQPGPFCQPIVTSHACRSVHSNYAARCCRRAYKYVVDLRAATPTDGMTADFYQFDMFLTEARLRHVSPTR
ncbi:hypothetical protein BraRD5C2_50810 [Bradyrhizobium sp. RD5-C2]|nr:hypothetical protein BraRD5C2_50810 [Bradyrhizobium sp. RD5-C2]